MPQVSPYLLMGPYKQPMVTAANQLPIVPPAMSLDQAPVDFFGASAQPTQQDMSKSAGAGVYSPPAPQPPPESSLPYDYQQAYQQALDVYNESIKNAEQQLLAAKNQHQQLDLSPLIALADQWSMHPSKLLSSYKPPADNQKNVQALQDAVLKGRQGSAELALKRAYDMSKFQEAKDARLQRLEELALKKEEVKGATQARFDDRQLKLQLQANKDYMNEFGEGISGLTEVVDAAQKARQLIKDSGGIPTGSKKFAEYKRQVSRMITGYNRDVAKLGALAGADKELLEAAAAKDPGRVMAILSNAMGYSDGQTAVLDSLIQAADDKMKEHEQLVGPRFANISDNLFKTQNKIYQKTRGSESQDSTQNKPEKIIQDGIEFTLNPETGEYE